MANTNCPANLYCGHLILLFNLSVLQLEAAPNKPISGLSVQARDVGLLGQNYLAVYPVGLLGISNSGILSMFCSFTGGSGQCFLLWVKGNRRPCLPHGLFYLWIAIKEIWRRLSLFAENKTSSIFFRSESYIGSINNLKDKVSGLGPPAG